ncbi:MAG: TetR/AcrR family transcriptional regulator [Burkholderiaceae bacterium]
MQRAKSTSTTDRRSASVEPARHRSDARDKILRAAERLFAEHGFDGCSLRTVAAAAKVNQGMIHYFFKSKETLFFEAYLNSGRSMVEQRLRLLDEEEAARQGEPIPLERLIEIFLVPAIELAMRGASGRSFLRMQSRLQLDASPVGVRLRSALYDESSRRYFDAFRRSLAGHSLEEVSWRFTFMLGTYQYALSSTGRLEYISGGRCSSKDYREALRQMIPYIAAGMRAGSPPALEPRRA